MIGAGIVSSVVNRPAHHMSSWRVGFLVLSLLPWFHVSIAAAEHCTSLGLAAVIYGEEGVFPHLYAQHRISAAGGFGVAVDLNTIGVLNTLDVALAYPIGGRFQVAPRVGPTVLFGYGNSAGLAFGLRLSRQNPSGRGVALEIAWRTFRQDETDSALPITSIGLAYTWGPPSR